MLWETRARVLHAFGRHTMIPVESWRRGQRIDRGSLCWLCPVRS